MFTYLFIIKANIILSIWDNSVTEYDFTALKSKTRFHHNGILHTLVLLRCLEVSFPGFLRDLSSEIWVIMMGK